MSPVDNLTMLPQNANDPPHVRPAHLNVTDALNYLDAIKSHYREQAQPDVYDQFLALMRQFKASEIDVQTTMERVAILFNDSPSLVLGFNLFLPVGYELKCAKDDLNANFITMITPTGTINLNSP